MRLLGKFFRISLVAGAVAAAIVPLPARLVESWYSRRLFPAVQGVVTPLTNLVPVAVLDVVALTLLTVLGVAYWRRVRADGFVHASLSSVLSLATLAAALFLIFLAMWGLNYRRVPLEQKLQYDRGRVTREAALRLGEHAVREVNTLYDAAQALDGQGEVLAAAFATAQRMLGSDRLATPGIPKRSLLERYFRAAAIDGMTDPFFLEVIINPDTLPFERPFVLTHEWAHLAGYANESEANFVAWLACTRADAMAQYSAWLAIYEHVAASVQTPDRKALAAHLATGPRHDLLAAAARYATATPVVQIAARDVYDTYLRANRVSDGVASYTMVVRLLLGAGLEEGGTPRLR